MQSTTVSTDRLLQTALWGLAAQHLGPQATHEEIAKLATEWYYGPERRERTRETPVQRWQREADFRATQRSIRKASGS